VKHEQCDVAVVTLLDREMRAVRSALQQMYDFHERHLRHGLLAPEAWLPAPGGRPIRVTAVQTHADVAGPAYRGLVEDRSPGVALLVGVAAAGRRSIEVGDVVLSNEVLGAGSRVVSPPLRHRLDTFFATVPAEQWRPGDDSYRVHRGPLGSQAGPRVLAVEAAAAGPLHEAIRQDAGLHGWLTVRGIADGYSGYDRAARHAAEVMAMLLPYLGFDRPRG
jgi:adenosylhomocysteine nucleosidase